MQGPLRCSPRVVQFRRGAMCTLTAARSISTRVPQPAGMVAKVAENVAALRENGTPVGEIRVLPSPVGPAFFSNCSPLIPPTLSALLHAQLRKGRFINATNHIIGGWAGLRCSGLSARVASNCRCTLCASASPDALQWLQLSTPLAGVALSLVGADRPPCLHPCRGLEELGVGCFPPLHEQGAAGADAAHAGWCGGRPRLAGRAQAPACTASCTLLLPPAAPSPHSLPLSSCAAQVAIDPPMLYAHVWECLGVAWAVHETVGSYMTAALVWLESRGTANPALLAQQYGVPALSALTAVPPQSGLAIQSADEEAGQGEGEAAQQQQQAEGEDEGHSRQRGGAEADEQPQQRAALLKRSNKTKRSKRQQ